MKNTLQNGLIKILNNGEGFAIVDREYLGFDVKKIKQIIAGSAHVKEYLDTPFHSILCLFKIIPELKDLILPKMRLALAEFGNEFRCISSTYYNKPPASKWALDFHQDTRINLTQKIAGDNVLLWTKQKEFYRGQPSAAVLEQIFAIRLHLDSADAENGALQIIPNSHQLGYLSAHSIQKGAITINAEPGDALLLRPLLLHASGYNRSETQRGVIHLEFSNLNLPWYEDYR